MTRTLKHRCRTGRVAALERDTVTYDVPVWRCPSCKTFFAVVDGDLTPNTTETT